MFLKDKNAKKSVPLHCLQFRNSSGDWITCEYLVFLPMPYVSELSFIHNRVPNDLTTERISSNPTTEKPNPSPHPQPVVESTFCGSEYIDKSFDFRSNQWYD